MLTKLLMTGALLCAAFYTHAQQVQINWGEEAPAEYAYQDMVLGPDNMPVKLSLDNSKNALPILTRYNATGNVQAQRVLETGDSDIRFGGIKSVKGKLYLFGSKYDKASRSTAFYVQKVDISTLHPEGAVIHLNTFSAINQEKQSIIRVELSKDSSKILLLASPPYEEEENEKYYICVYDDQLNKQWEKDIKLSLLNKSVVVYSQMVTNDGQVGMIMKYYDREVKKADRDEMPDYTTKILMYRKEQDQPKTYVLDLQNSFLHDIHFASDPENNLNLFGLYRNLSKGNITGYFIAGIEPSSDALTIKKKEPFPAHIINRVVMDKQGSDKKNDPGLSGFFTLYEVVSRGNKSTDYLLQYKSSIYFYDNIRFVDNINKATANSVSHPYWVYTIGDIIDINMKQNGETSLFILPKEQYSANHYNYSGFTSIVKGDSLLLFYNEYPNNLKRSLDRIIFQLRNFDKSIYTMAVIDAAGNITRKAVYDNHTTKRPICTSQCRKMGNSRIALYARGEGLLRVPKEGIGLLEVE